MATPTQDALLGAEVLGYTLEERIGEGSVGIVYRGVKPGTEAVAIKVVRPELAHDSRYALTVIAEARAVSSIGHAGIVGILDLGLLADGRPFLVMELVNGPTLEDVLAEGPMAPDDALEVLDELLAALDAAHRKNVLHRDIKPANIVLTTGKDGRRVVKLLDFGLARLNFAPGSTASMVVGTPDYMAPEQASSKLTYASDLYAAGVVAFRMVTGQLPFIGASTMEVIFAHVRQTPQKPSGLKPGLSPKLDALVLSLLEKSPSQRPQSAEAARAAIDDLRRGSGLQKAVPKAPLPTDETMKPFTPAKPFVIPSLMDDDEVTGSGNRTEPFRAYASESGSGDVTERPQQSPFAKLPPQRLPPPAAPDNETVREMTAQSYGEEAFAPTKQRQAIAPAASARTWPWVALALVVVVGTATFVWFRLH